MRLRGRQLDAINAALKSDDPNAFGAALQKTCEQAEAIGQFAPCPGSPATWPDIGQDPLKASDMDVENALERLRKACSLQQKEVPDQTALCWRIDLSRALGEIAWLRGRVRVLTKSEQQENK